MKIETISPDNFFWLILEKNGNVFELQSAYKIHPETKQIFGKDVSSFLYEHYKTDTYIRNLRNKFRHFYEVNSN